MMNGKRVKSVKDIKAIYESIAIGDEIKFGLKRDGNMMMAALKKPIRKIYRRAR